jgi:Signal peptidase subunit
MHNTLTRVQNAFGFFTSCAFTLAALIAVLSTIPFPAPASPPSASISVRNVQVVKGRPHYYSPKREEYANIRFDLDADLSSLFTWNTKQLFVYVMASYPSSSTIGAGSSDAVIWDAIIPAPSTPYSFQNLKARYFPDKGAKSTRTRKSSTSNKTKELVKPGVLILKNQKPKYQITDPSGVMSERSNATLTVGWNIQPWVGALIWDQSLLGNRIGAWDVAKVGRSEPFNFPALKSSKTETVKVGEGAKTPQDGSASPVVSI